MGALVAIAAGLPTMVALIAAAADPGRSLIPVALATGLSAVIAGLALVIRLREARDEVRVLSEKLENVQDKGWEFQDFASSREKSPTVLPIATVSHEMRTPLHGMLGLTDLLLETPLTPEQQSYSHAIRSSAAALSRLVDDLLDYSRIEAGRFLLEASPVRLEPLMEQIVELLSPRAHAKGIGLAAHVDRSLPIVIVDEIRLRQVLINLVGNAISFTEKGGVVLAAELGRPAPGGMIAITFSVTDSGTGIAPEDRERIFADFEKGENSRGGAGLGLAISSRIVNRMGGRIEVTERAGNGSVFGFTLVLPRRQEVTGPLPETLKGSNLLIIAEPTLEMDNLAAHLAEAGAAPRIVKTVIDAAGLVGAAEAAELGYPVVLMQYRRDLDMKLAISRLREAAGRPIPAVVLLEPSERRQAEKLKEDGFDAYLIRPIRRSSLLRIAAEVIDGRGGFRADPIDRPRGDAPLAANAFSVLVAEDDPVSALLIRAVLERSGHDVTDAGTAALAREAVAQGDYDVVIVDVHLAEDDGLALIRRLRETSRKRFSIIAISGSTEMETRLSAERAGADLYLEKPVSPDTLRRAIEAVAARRAA